MPQTEDGQRIELGSAQGADQVHAEPAAISTSLPRAQVLEAMHRNYRQVQYHYVQFLAEHLTDCRKTLGGDFDDLMMLAVLGQRFIGAVLGNRADDTEVEKRVWMSALRLSDVTGIPRESVRRKLFRLEARGWVTHDPALGWKLAGTMETANARIELSELDNRGIERLARLVCDLLPYIAPEVRSALSDRGADGPG